MEAMPHVAALHHTFARYPFQIVSINIEPDNLTTVRDVVENLQLPFPVYVDSGRAQQLLRVQMYPTAVLVDAEGRIAHYYAGSASLKYIEDDVRALLTALTGKPVDTR